MRAYRFLGFSVLTAGVAAMAFGSAFAQPPAKAAQQQKRAQKLAEIQKKAEVDRKAAETKKAEEGKKADELAKLQKTLKVPAKLPAGPITKDASELARRIDSALDAKLAAEKIPPSPTCTDAEFVRRVYLDLTGVIPPADKARTFVDSKEADKRTKLVDELLDSSNYGRHMADVWFSLLVQRTSDNRRVDFAPFREWLTKEFNANRPWSELVSELVASTGEYEKEPAVGFYLSNNTVDKMTDQVTKLFLGVSMQCAQCHDHKFEDWKQKEYWSFSQFFMKVSVGGLRPQQGASPGVNETDRVNRRQSPLPESAMTLPASFLRDGGAVKVSPSDPYRPTLAKWVTGKSNPYFAKAMVNRVWSQFFGRGFVNPLTDMGPSEEASHPELLAELAHQFAGGGFDLKNFLRAVCLTNAYQRSSKPVSGNDEDKSMFSHMAVKVMSPEMLFDSTMVVTGGPGAGAGPAGRTPMAQQKGAPVGRRDQFVNFFLAGADATNSTEYEAGIPQALKLMNSRQMMNPASVRTLIGLRPVKAEAIEKLYLTTLARRPTADETKKMAEYVAKSPLEMDGYADVLWALLNCSEFTMVR